jgi:hypothetical protein
MAAKHAELSSRSQAVRNSDFGRVNEADLHLSSGCEHAVKMKLKIYPCIQIRAIRNLVFQLKHNGGHAGKRSGESTKLNSTLSGTYFFTETKWRLQQFG